MECIFLPVEFYLKNVGSMLIVYVMVLFEGGN